MKLVNLNGDEYKKMILEEVSNGISERRLKFSNFFARMKSAGKATEADQKLAEAYLSGIDDANRIVQFFMGNGPDISDPSFFKKAIVHEPSEYGMHNMKAEEAIKYTNSVRIKYHDAIVQNKRKELGS
jgi:hypothetical protein